MFLPNGSAQRFLDKTRVRLELRNTVEYSSTGSSIIPYPLAYQPPKSTTCTGESDVLQHYHTLPICKLGGCAPPSQPIMFRLIEASSRPVKRNISIHGSPSDLKELLQIQSHQIATIYSRPSSDRLQRGSANASNNKWPSHLQAKTLHSKWLTTLMTGPSFSTSISALFLPGLRCRSLTLICCVSFFLAADERAPQ